MTANVLLVHVVIKRTEIRTFGIKMKSARRSVRPPAAFKNNNNMDSLIPPFWKNPPPDFLGLSGQ